MSKTLTYIILLLTLTNQIFSSQTGNELLRFLAKPKNSPNTNKSNYDSYVLSFQWGKSFCISKGDEQSCEDKLKNAEVNTFTLHGLWPGLKTGARIPECTQGVEINPDAREVFQTMSHEWPSFTNPNKKFWEHEYNKHGYCYSAYTNTTNEPMKFFEKTLEVFHSKPYRQIYQNLEKRADNRWDYEDIHKQIEKVIGPGFQLQCIGYEGQQLLNEVHIYLDLDLSVMTNPKFSGRGCNPSKQVTILPFDYDLRSSKVSTMLR